MSENTFRTIREAVDALAELTPEAMFVIGPEASRGLTFAELQHQSNKIARALSNMGLAPGDKVSFLLDNGLFTTSLFLGTMYGGFVAVPLNPRAGRSHLAYALEHCDASVVFTSADYVAEVDGLRSEVGRRLQIIETDWDTGPHWPEGQCEGSCLELSPHDDALLIYTSGSTGRPKGVLLSHGNLIAAAYNVVAAHELTPDDRSLCVLPLYHLNAPTVTLLPSLVVGASVVMPHKFQVRAFWEWTIEYRCTWSAMAPTIVSQLVESGVPGDAGLPEAHRRIRFMRSSSAPLPPATQRGFEEAFRIPLIEAMGSTEAGGAIFSNPLPPHKNKMGSPGRAFGFETRVVDSGGIDVPQGDPGEILLRGP
ncbi:MAG: long-chain fatty acid--CoA ligase, partial [Planctomycetaceae bacterium]